mmetsp:Transcript_1352/g.1821  ORF Transcript_1352/g.1821 Transcript_1352/m.1821 type:complete len:121 (-) Transcript_1352:1053-1415(-)
MLQPVYPQISLPVGGKNIGPTKAFYTRPPFSIKETALIQQLFLVIKLGFKGTFCLCTLTNITQTTKDARIWWGTTKEQHDLLPFYDMDLLLFICRKDLISHEDPFWLLTSSNLTLELLGG